ncbi:hypothetical protein D0X99_19480 [Algoriphagus lacus]|uniref:Glycosyltransferase RgtA/B/C/D-like domain-containing protein n=1 Tax=Algoriphagus lacus TaxID=2056311 RepID=A0A418PLN3_9BACT|nr:hypothetical protein [Algoriphagus lacus]RIW12266.1 hypothetical protein D0X99_19480 [Algoriphagus lacus]
MGKILPASAILVVFMIMAGLNRGFDISDEGLYVLLADPLQANVAGIFNYDLLLKLNYQLFGYSFSLVELRFLRLLLYLAGAWALIGFWKNVAEEHKLDWSHFWILCLGIFSGYAFLPPTLSYNSLTVVLTCFWLKLISEAEFSVKTVILLGVVLAFFAYVKISLVMIFILMTILAILFLKKENPFKVVLLFLPFIFLELIFFMLLDENALTRLTDGIPLNRQRPTYQLVHLIKSVLVGVFWVAIPAFFFFGVGYLGRTKKNALYNIMAIVAIGGFCLVCFLTHVTEEWNHIVLIFSAAVLGYYFGKGPSPFGILNLWAIILFLLPFLLHFGSNVYWLRIGIHYWVFWIMAFFLLSKIEPRKLSIPISFISLVLVFNGIWWHPFGLDTPLWTEKVEWIRNGNETIYIDREQVELAKKIKEWKSLSGNTELLAAYRIPGLVWLADLRIPYSPGFWEERQLIIFFKSQPKEMIYCNLEALPKDWSFGHAKNLGQIQGNNFQLLWD